MPRALRVDFPGAHHHVMNRGARKAPIFEAEGARQMFQDVLRELPERFGVRIHSYATMPNHYHLQVTSPELGLSPVMKYLDQVVTQRLNARHGWDGPVFRGRYHDVLIAHDAHWDYLLAYIHGNPARSGLAERMIDPLWTSHAAYAGALDLDWLDRGEFAHRFAGPAEYVDWLQGVLEQRIPAPDGFAPESWGGPKLEFRPPPRTTRSPMEALELLEALTQRPVPRGRSRDPLALVACWWLRASGARVVDVARLLETSTATVVRRTDAAVDASRRDDRVASWMAALSGSDPRRTRAA